MKFINRNKPQQFTDLVFRDTNVAAILQDYSQGLRDKHLLLYGPAGSGKSIAAQTILDTLLGDLAGTVVGKPINASEYSFTDFGSIMNNWNTQKLNGLARCYTLIDEVDLFSDRMLQKLRAFMDGTELGTIICTTNNLHKLDEPFKDRFRCLLVERPVEKDWTKRAQEILASEGVQLTQSEVVTLLNGFNGSARSLMDWLEDYVTLLKGMPSSQQSAALLAKPSGITLKSNKTLVNGRLPNNTQGGQNGL